jgi:hypothetical protein
MEKDRELRYQSFEDVRFDVAPIQRELKRRFVEEKMVTAQQAYRFRAASKRHRLSFASADA